MYQHPNYPARDLVIVQVRISVLYSIMLSRNHTENITKSIANGSFCSYSTATKKRVEDEDDMKMLAAWAS